MVKSDTKQQFFIHHKNSEILKLNQKLQTKEFPGTICHPLRLPHTSSRTTKNLHLPVNSDKSVTSLGLVREYLTVQDLETSCWALLSSVQWTKTICRFSRVPQSMRNCHESHVNKRLFQHGIFSKKASFNFHLLGAILIWMTRPQA